MNYPTNNFSYLWNDMSFEERSRLIPHSIESHKLHVWQCKQKAIKAHKAHMKELDDLMRNLDRDLPNE